MKLEVTNANYSAMIVQVKNLIELENCDNVQALPMFGYQAIVSKDVMVGDWGILFPSECQLSHDYCKNNNLYRHQEMNIDINEKGYIEDNRRVKAVKFRGHKSSALFMPLKSFLYMGISGDEFLYNSDNSFNNINGVEICNKYYVRKKGYTSNYIAGKHKKFERIDNKTFPEHLDSEQYFRNIGRYRDNDDVIITQKLHGTSARFGYVKVRRKLNWIERVLKKLGVKISEIEYDYIAGSRRVIKDTKSSASFDHYYDDDIWNITLNKIKDLIPKDYIIYGEIVGWIGNSPIQKGYTYQIQKGDSELYIYRIAIVNDDGVITDLSWDAMNDFAQTTGLKLVPFIARIKHHEANIEQYLDKKYHVEGFPYVLPLDEGCVCDEGVCIRKESIIPYVSKAKSPLFYEYETKMLDAGVEDVETEQS